MKKLLLFLFTMMLSVAALFAQAPQKMSYQVVVRNTSNALVTNQNVSAKISILQGSVNGTPVYVETHTATTNVNGLLTLEVGDGTTVTGSLEAVNWAEGPFFLKSEIDPDGGINYSIEGTQQLLSVPYALYAEKAGNVPAFAIVPADSGYVINITQPGQQPQTFFLPTGGGQGPAGEDGLSAYQLWLNAGNTGTEADFLASLVGAPGNDGNDGIDGKGILSIVKTGTEENVDTYTITYTDSTSSTFTVTNGVDGTNGTDGNDGVSPTITVSQGDAGTVLIITDVNGSQQVTIPSSTGGSEGGTLVQQQVNWSDTNITSVTYILNKPTKLSQFENDLNFVSATDIPAQQQADWNETDTSSVVYIKNKPEIPTVPTNVSELSNDAGYITMDSIPAIPIVPTNVSEFTNDAGYITMDSIPEMPEVPTKLSDLENDMGFITTIPDSIGGISIEYDPIFTAWNKDYNDLINTPDIPTVPTNVSEFTNDAGYITMDSIPTIPTNVSELTNDAGYITMDSIPAIPTVPTNVSAFTNDAGYITMDSIPAIPDAQVNADWEATSGVAQIMNKPVLADVAFSGSYDDLEDTPTIPAAQVNSDWDATSGVAEILNKPDFAGMQNALDSLQNAMSDMQYNLDNEMGFICGISKVKDYDGNEYNTVKIGNQCWLKENLRSTHYSDGTEIPYSSTLSTSVGYRCYPNNDSANVAKFGYLYNWTAFMNGADAVGGNPSGVQGICPKGWHVPSWTEFDILWIYVRDEHPEWRCNSNAENISKALAATTDWQTSTYECAIGNDLTQNNASGFSALPAGMHSSSYTKFSLSTYFWTTSYYSLDSTRRRTLYLGNNDRKLFSQNSGLDVGHSVRCLKDETVGAIENEFNRLQNYIDSVTNTFTCGISKVKDYDGNEYHTIKIGDQCWMKENMRAQHYSDGTAIQTGTDTSSTTPYYYYHSESYRYSLEDLGLYYNWAAAMNNSASSSANPSGVQGVCPTGWHVPSSSEWNQLYAYARSQSSWLCDATSSYIGKALASDQYWGYNSSSCVPGNDYSQNNASGFSAIAGGLANYYGSPNPTIHFGGNYGFQFMAWASDIVSGGDKAKYAQIHYQYTGAYVSSYSIYCGLSVRCLRDPETPAPTGLTPEDVQNMINNAIAPLQNQINQQQNTIDSLNTALSLSTCGLYTVKDYDNNIYQTVRIGNQCWLRENMRAKHFSDGTAIIHGLDSSSTAFYYYYPNNDSTIVNSYGLLYNWPATMHGESFSNANPSGRQGVCPVGWHVPSSSEWVQLRNYLSNNSDYVCGDTNINVGKALAATTGWVSNTTNCTAGYQMETNNATGFSALPAGFYGISTTGGSNFGQFGNQACFWTSSWPGVGSYRNVYTIYSYFKILGGPTSGRIYESFSVRCLKD